MSTHFHRFAILLLCLLNTPAIAADFEITPLIGYRLGTAVLEAEVCAGFCPSADTAEDVTYGVAFGRTLGEHWLVELRASRQEADLDFRIFPCAFCLTVAPEGEFEQTTVLLGLERRFQLDRFEPFLAFGAGVTRLETNEEAFLPFPEISEVRPAVSVASGIRLPISELLSLRLEVRGLYTDLPGDIASGDLVQLEVSSGLTFRF